MGAYIFAYNIESQPKEEYHRILRRTFLVLDILCVFVQLFYWWHFGAVVHFWVLDGYVFGITAAMFTIDALLLVWLLERGSGSDSAPIWLLVINWISNLSRLVPYIVGRAVITQWTIYVVESCG